MATGQFRSGDKVFAKVRGYPPWPALITGYADETPSRLKFNVYFYGTKETAVCKPEELYDYIKHREKYNKPIKRRHFVDGMRELELELDEKDRNPDLFKGMKVPGEDSKLESDDDSSLVIDEAGPSKKAKVDGANVSKRKSSAAVSDTTANFETPESDGNKANPEVVSRSGRKIKPKKFLDDAASAEASPSGSSSGVARNTPKSKQSPKEDSAENGSAELSWPTAQDADELLDVVQQTDALPGEVKENIGTAVQNSVVGRSANSRLEPLKIEVQLLDCNCRIKSSLNLVNANCVDCLAAMEDLLQLNLNALMLKKHPEVLDTVRKLKNYVGNLSKWNFSEEKEREFKENAIKIRSKAMDIYNKMRQLFTIPDGMAFRTLFEEELAKFRENTSGMTQNQVYALTTEPDAVNGH